MFSAVKRWLFGTTADKPGESRRSSHWPAVRKQWLKDHPACAACGTTKDVEVHHKQPFHLFPELELDPANFITLCEGRPGCNCHLTFGHLGNWTLFNPSVVDDAAEYLKKFMEARTKGAV